MFACSTLETVAEVIVVTNVTFDLFELKARSLGAIVQIDF